MKFKIFFFLTFIFYLAHSQYLPILEEGNSWSVDTFYCPFDPPNYPTWTITEQITINGIVEVNGINYKQIYSDETPSCLLREEDGVVYKYFPDENIERILIDMNLEVGDVIPMQFNSGFIYPYCAGDGFNVVPISLEVFEIEVLFIAGEDRKVIKFVDENFPNTGEELRWIEGIGTTAGLGIPYAFQDISCGSILSCYTTGGNTYFMFGATSCDNTTLSIGDSFKQNIILYPNPISDRSILQFPAEAKIDFLKIYSLSGRLIKEEKINTNNYILNNMDFASGLYFFQVSSKGKNIKTEKFIVK